MKISSRDYAIPRTEIKEREEKSSKIYIYIWDIIMHTNIHIMGVPGRKVRERSRKNTWRSNGWKRLIDTFKKLNKLKVGKHKEIRPGNHAKNSEDVKKILKATKRKVTHHIQGDPTKISNSLPIQNNKVKTVRWHMQILKEKNYQPRT